jgi:L-lysine 2,3-aminomutase
LPLLFPPPFPYQENLPKNDDWLNIKKYIETTLTLMKSFSVAEILLTLSNRKIALWLERLESSSTQNLRIHSRVPIVIPNRIDEELISLLKNSRLRIIVVIHSNHASELDDLRVQSYYSYHYIILLFKSGSFIGVNDSAQTLTDLSYRLFEARVMPYYLHVLDKVKGAQHFDLRSSEIDHIYKMY